MRYYHILLFFYFLICVLHHFIPYGFVLHSQKGKNRYARARFLCVALRHDELTQEFDNIDTFLASQSLRGFTILYMKWYLKIQNKAHAKNNNNILTHRDGTQRDACRTRMGGRAY